MRVPATSANLGPGFDALGLALALYDEVSVDVTASGLHIDVEGEGADQVPRDERHLIVSALRVGFEALDVEPPGLALTCRNRIPHSRGLGSSSAAVLAGLLAARALAGGRAALPDLEVLRLATGLEGHPDNVAACLLGGLTIAWTEPAGPRAVRLEPAADIAPVLYVPSLRSSTARTRELLPATVDYQDAVANVGRSALLVHALSARPDLLLPATEDRLHQPYRAADMPATLALVAHLRSTGIAAAVSGAGPSVLAFATGTPPPAHVDDSWTVLELSVDRAGACAHVSSTARR